MSFRRTQYILAALLLAGSALAAETPKERIVWVQGNLNPAFGLYLSNPDGSHERPFLTDSGSNYNPSFSFDGRWIVFTSERFGSADVFRVHPDGSGLERLTDSPAFDDQGVLSPNGRTLAFVSTREGGYANIWLMDLASRRLRNLSRSKAGNFRPSWSPDGKWIAFSSDRDIHRMRYVRGASPAWELMQTTAIYIVHPDGSGLRRLTALDGSAATPKWSPDGHRVLFEQVLDMKELREFREHTEIASIDIETGAHEVLTDGTKKLWSPSFVGTQEIGYGIGDPTFRTGVVGGKFYFLGTSVAYHSGLKGPTGGENPSWSPDGSALVYDKNIPMERPRVQTRPSRDSRYELLDGAALTHSSLAFMPDGNQFIYPDGDQLLLADLDSTASRVIFDGSEQNRVLGTEAVLSANGKTLAFAIRSSKHPEEAGQFAVANSDGTRFRVVVTHDHDVHGFMSLSPNGANLVYADSIQQPVRVEKGLRILSLADGKITDLTTGWDNTPDWSPRGDRIVFTGFETGDFEIYTIRPDGSGLRQLTHDHGDDSHPIWSPDGKWIAFVSSRMGWKDEALLPWHGPQTYGEIFVMRSDGSDVRQLTDNQWEELVLAWLPSASQVTVGKAATAARNR